MTLNRSSFKVLDHLSCVFEADSICLVCRKDQASMSVVQLVGAVDMASWLLHSFA